MLTENIVDLEVHVLDGKEATEVKKIRRDELENRKPQLEKEVIHLSSSRFHIDKMVWDGWSFFNTAQKYHDNIPNMPSDIILVSAAGMKEVLDILEKNINDYFEIPYLSGSILLEAGAKKQQDIDNKRGDWISAYGFMVDMYPLAIAYLHRAATLFTKFSESHDNKNLNTILTTLTSYGFRGTAQLGILINAQYPDAAKKLCAQAEENVKNLLNTGIYISMQGPLCLQF